MRSWSNRVLAVRRVTQDNQGKKTAGRLSKHPEMPGRKSTLLKQQKGKCAWCGLHFFEGDVMEIDHIEPISCGGKDKWENLQLLHRHCHDEKTANDGSQKSRNVKRETH